jgi:hypothetical protein
MTTMDGRVIIICTVISTLAAVVASVSAFRSAFLPRLRRAVRRWHGDIDQP